MTVSSDTLAMLMKAGLAGDQLLDVVRSIEADNPASPPMPAGRSAAAIRQARYRERHAERLKEERLPEIEWLPLVGQVVRRDGCCVYCGATAGLTADHVVPVIQGGSHDLSNLVAACRPCNASKGGRTPEEWAASGNPVASRYVTRVTAERYAAPAPDKRNPQTPKKINPTPCEGGARAREAEPVFSWAARLAAAQVAIATLVESLEQLNRKRWRGMPPPPGVNATQWKGFLDHRKSQRKSLTDHAYLLLCNRLEKHADPEWPPGRIIDTIIERGWLSFEKPWLTRITEQEHGKRAHQDRSGGARRFRDPLLQSDFDAGRIDPPLG